jgi:dienelactone hydrolase
MDRHTARGSTGVEVWDDHVAEIKETRQKEWDDKVITIGDKKMKLLEKNFGEKPKDGWNLFISLHGGGSDPGGQTNESQWHNQIRLYQPENSLYICPRAPTNTWDLWHQDHMDALFDRLIEDAIVLGEVDPNHMYIMGYSAGGDGVYHIATRMTDRWAAAAMMAGHPADVSPLSLRNIGFALHVGGDDAAYDRNKIGAQWKVKLDALQAADPKGYEHQVEVHAGKPHWMDLEDAVAVPWMEKFTRNPIPDKVVWVQGDKAHDRSYWVATPASEAKKGQQIIASRDGQTITIEKTVKVKTVSILFSDKMLDLDKPVTITMDGKELFKGIVPRSIGELHATLVDRGDPEMVFSAMQTVTIN